MNNTSEKWIEKRTVRWKSQCLVEILLDTAWLELTNTSPPAFSQRAKRFGADCWFFFLGKHSHSDNGSTPLHDVSHRNFQLSDVRITKMGPNCQTCKVGGSPFTGCSVNFQIPNVWNQAAVQTNHSFGLGVINHTSHDVTPPYDMRTHLPSIRQIQHAPNHQTDPNLEQGHTSELVVRYYLVVLVRNREPAALAVEQIQHQLAWLAHLRLSGPNSISPPIQLSSSSTRQWRPQHGACCFSWHACSLRSLPV